MEEPASSGGGSRKRPWEAPLPALPVESGTPPATQEQEERAGIGDPKSDEGARDDAAQKTMESGNLSGRAVPVSVGKEDRDGGGIFSECDEDESDVEDAAEMADLQRALEYLVSERDIEKVYNGDGKQPQKSNDDKDVSRSNADNAAANRQDGGLREDEQPCMIPNLVNRILMEHYSPGNQRNIRNIRNDATAKKDCMTRNQRDRMTQLLLAVIVEFCEPYFARMARRKQRERTQKQKQRQEKKQKPKKPRGDNAAKQSEAQPSLGFDERAVSWATSCVKQLLQPAPSTSLPPGTRIAETTENGHADLADDTRIPELDALLAASGPHDGLEMEQRMQDAMLQGLQACRLLESLGMASDFKRTARS